jgi:hypothetical protein
MNSFKRQITFHCLTSDLFQLLQKFHNQFNKMPPKRVYIALRFLQYYNVEDRFPVNYKKKVGWTSMHINYIYLTAVIGNRKKVHGN